MLFKGHIPRRWGTGRKYPGNITASRSGNKWHVPEESKPRTRRRERENKQKSPQWFSYPGIEIKRLLTAFPALVCTQGKRGTSLCCIFLLQAQKSFHGAVTVLYSNHQLQWAGASPWKGSLSQDPPSINQTIPSEASRHLEATSGAYHRKRLYPCCTKRGVSLLMYHSTVQRVDTQRGKSKTKIILNWP